MPYTYCVIVFVYFRASVLISTLVTSKHIRLLSPRIAFDLLQPFFLPTRPSCRVISLLNVSIVALRSCRFCVITRVCVLHVMIAQRSTQRCLTLLSPSSSKCICRYCMSCKALSLDVALHEKPSSLLMLLSG